MDNNDFEELAQQFNMQPVTVQRIYARLLLDNVTADMDTLRCALGRLDIMNWLDSLMFSELAELQTMIAVRMQAMYEEIDTRYCTQQVGVIRDKINSYGGYN